MHYLSDTYHLFKYKLHQQIKLNPKCRAIPHIKN